MIYNNKIIPTPMIFKTFYKHILQRIKSLSYNRIIVQVRPLVMHFIHPIIFRGLPASLENKAKIQAMTL